MVHSGKLAGAEQDVVASYLSGLSLQQAADRFGVSKTAVRFLLKRKKVLRRKAPFRRYHFNEAFFEVIDTEAKAYWLGFLAADGYVSRTGSYVTMILAEEDAAHVDLLAKTVEHPAGCRSIPAVGRDQPKRACQFCSKKMASDLASHGVVNAKSLTLQPWSTPDEKLQAAFWRGMVDGDGCLAIRASPRNPQVPFYTLDLIGTRAVVEAFRNFVVARIPAGYSRRGGPAVQQSGGSKAFHVTFGGRGGVIEAVKLLYANAEVTLPRKLVIAQEMMADTSARPPLSRLSAAELTDLRNHLGSWKLVASHLGYSVGGFDNMLRKAGVRRRRRHFLTEEKLLGAYRVSGSWKAASRGLGVGYDTIAYHRKRLGVPLRPTV